MATNITESYLYEFEMGKEDLRKIKYFQEEARRIVNGNGNKESLISAVLALGSLVGYFCGPVGTVAGAVGTFVSAFEYVASGDKRLIQGSVNNGLKDVDQAWNDWFSDYDKNGNPISPRADRLRAHVTLMEVETDGDVIKFVTSMQQLAVLKNGVWVS